MNNLNPIISIIVPIYNVEVLLSKCIDSVLKQTYSNFELLLINDGSTDDSGKVCDKYAQIDSRIHVFHKDNGGVSSARNLGLNYAQGNLICFIDSDDWIEDTYLSDFDFVNNKADLYVQGYKKYSARKHKIISEHYLNTVDIHSNLPQFYIEVEEKHIINSPCFKLFSREIINSNSIRFDEFISFGEDHLFSLDFFYNCASVFLTPKAGYVYFISDSESLTKKYVSCEKMRYYSLNSYLLRAKIIEKYNVQDVLFSKFIHQEFERFYILSIYSIFDKRGKLSYNEKNNLFALSVEYVNSNRSLFSYKISSSYFELNRMILIDITPFKYLFFSLFSRFYTFMKTIKRL